MFYLVKNERPALEVFKPFLRGLVASYVEFPAFKSWYFINMDSA
jgi:hypothetical protein